MSILADKPTRDEWIMTSQAKKTQNMCKTVLSRFDDWLKLKGTTEELFFDAMRGANESQRASTVRDIQNYWLETVKSRSAQTYRSVLIMWFEENGCPIPQSKLRRLARLPKPEVPLKYTPSKKEVAALINTIAKQSEKCFEDYKLFFTLLSCTSMRHGELLEVRADHIDLDQRSIRIPASQTKTRRERVAFFTPQAKKILQKYWAYQEKARLSVHKYRRLFDLHQSSYQYQIDQARKKLGIFKTEKDWTMHRLRAWCSQVIKDNTKDEFGELMLGHTAGNKTYDHNVSKWKKLYDKAVPDLTLELEDEA